MDEFGEPVNQCCGVYSLYDLSVASICRGFGLIDINYFKGLPSILLKDVISSLNPLDLESIENECILTSRGISTLSLWKSHCLNRWKYIDGISRAGTNSHAWRNLYFQQHLQELVNKLSRSNKHEHQNILKDSCQALFLGLQEVSHLHIFPMVTEKKRRLEDIHNMIDLCAKHLHQIRLFNAMCLYLARNMDILMRLAESVVHLSVFGLKSTGVNSLSRILPLMLRHKLTSLTLDGSFLENEADFRLLLLALSNSCLISDSGNSFQCQTLSATCGTKENAVLFPCCSSVQSKPGTMEYGEEDIFRENHEVSTQIDINEASHTDTVNEISEDDLYDDIFSQNSKFPKPVPSANSSYTRSSMLTMLELNECLLSRDGLKAFAETLEQFRNLHTLVLRETGSVYYSEMNELISKMRSLVENGSLCCVEVKSSSIDDHQGMMFCDMIMEYCQKCSNFSSKGLRSLNLHGSMIAGESTGDCMSQRLTTCSHCGDGDFVSEGLRQLHLENFVGASGMKSIFKSIYRNQSLQSLSFPSCWLRKEDIVVLFNYISGSGCRKSNNTITKLNLRENPSVPLDYNLCNVIKQSQLMYLDLSYCGIEVIPDDVILALCSNNILKVLKIAGNRLGDNGGAAITRIFKTKEKKSGLMSLDLSCNRMTASSLLHLGQVLQTWPKKLTDISIIGNLLNDSHEDVKTCLEKVFDIVLTKRLDTSMAFVDHISEM